MTKNNHAVPLLVLSALFLQNCATTTRVTDNRRVALDKTLSLAPLPEDLRQGLDDLLGAQRSCRFPDRLRQRLSAIPAGWEEIETRERGFCLGELEVTDVQQAEDTLFVIQLESPRQPGSTARERYLVMARYRPKETRWVLGWPAPMGAQKESDRL